MIINYTDNKLPDDINFKNVVMLMACIVKGDDRFYQQLFLEEALLEVRSIIKI